MTTNTTDEESVVIAEGLEALRQALAAEGMAYATDRCAEEYARALDAARRVADAAGLGGADRRAYVAHMDTFTRARVLVEATRRRDQEVLFANQQFAEWRRSVGARARSIPQSLHQFEDR
jgi:hypothetical protein